MIATAAEPIHLGRFHATLSDAAGTRPVEPIDAARTGRSPEGLDVSIPLVPWRLSTALRNCVELLAVVWSLALVVLAVGTPIVLVAALLLWLARLALRMF
jgi:hypothetical protein